MTCRITHQLHHTCRRITIVRPSPIGFFRPATTSRIMSDFPPPELKAAAEQVATLLRERKETISVAETAAGGLISAALLSTPGASRVYKGGLTLYTLESRIAFAGWTQANVEKYDGPTPDLVAGLASHVRQTLHSTYTVGESGTAGPTASGKARNRQPGYVAVAVVGDKGELSRDFDTGLGNDRQANMVAFAVGALKLVHEFITGATVDRGDKL